MRYATSLPVGGTWTAISGSGATTTSHTVSGLTNGMRYYFEIRATNANGISPWNNAGAAVQTVQLATSPSTAVTIPDTNLRTALETATGKAVGATITQLDMAKLTDLQVWGGIPISDLSGLEHVVNVSYLALSGQSISDLAPLASLTALTSINLGTNLISDLSPLTGLTSLSSIVLARNSISDVTPLTGLTSLRWITLSHNLISDPSPLAAMTWAYALYLDGNPIARVSDVLDVVASFTLLRHLGLSGASDSDLLEISVAYPHLYGLVLTDGSIADPTPVSRLTSLQSLSLDGNLISDLPPLAGLASLSELILNRNLISDLSPVAGLARLRSLRAYQNSISDLSPLAGLAALRSLELRDNLISDVSPLTLNAGLASGSHIWIGSNPLSTASFNAHIPALRARGATVWWPDPIPTDPPAAPTSSSTGRRAQVPRPFAGAIPSITPSSVTSSAVRPVQRQPGRRSAGGSPSPAATSAPPIMRCTSRETDGTRSKCGR